MSDRVSGQVVANNVTAATIIKLGPGRCAMVSVLSGTNPATIHDTTTTGAAAIGNQIAAVPGTVGTYLIDMPFYSGLVVVPGVTTPLAVSYV